MASSIVDPEKGLATATARPVMPSPTSFAPVNANANANANTNVTVPGDHTPLQLFQQLVGIHTPTSLTQDGADSGRSSSVKSRRSQDNIGLYRRAIQQERSSRIAYLCTSFISNTLYMLQILLAAVFTALSAYKATHPVTLTVLGAFNTVLAGCLAWQKGQGVPQRYRKAQDEYQALILEIEMVERAFLDIQNGNNAAGADGAKLDPRAEKVRLQKLFDTARADQQANYPDLYVSTGGAANAKDNKDLSKQLNDTKADAAKVQSDLLAKIDSLLAQLENKAVDTIVQKVAKS